MIGSASSCLKMTPSLTHTYRALPIFHLIYVQSSYCLTSKCVSTCRNYHVSIQLDRVKFRPKNRDHSFSNRLLLRILSDALHAIVTDLCEIDMRCFLLP